METCERCVGETGCAGCLRGSVDARQVVPLDEIRRGEEGKMGWDEGAGCAMIFFEHVGFGELVLQVEFLGSRL